jgi:hypothetical protein
LGPRQTWFILLLPLEYSIITSAYTMTGILSFGFSDPVLAGLVSVSWAGAGMLFPDCCPAVRRYSPPCSSG